MDDCYKDNIQNGEQTRSNMIFHRFKRKLKESNFKIKCRKCEDKPGFVLLQKKDVYCGDCLLEYCTHKFRSTIGKSRLVKVGDKVLVGFSGGLSSVALVDMIRRGLDEDVHRKLRFEPSLIYIDESVTMEDNENLGLTQELFQFMMKSELVCYFTTLQFSIEPNFLKLLPDEFTDDSYEKVKDFFNQSKFEHGEKFLKCYNNLQNSTSKYDFLLRLKNLIIVKMAEQLNFDKVFLANTMDELSIGIMNNISFGRGMIVQSEINFADDRYNSLSILLLRPMCEFSNKEVAFYLKYRKLDHLCLKTDSSSTKCPIKSSIHRITEHFLTQLSEEFPSTLFTVYKTGNKITHKYSNDQEKRCKFCLGKLDHNLKNNSNYSSYDALKLSSILSTGSDDIRHEDEEAIDYCYGCLKIRNEINKNQNCDNSNGDDLDLFQQFCILSI